MAGNEKEQENGERLDCVGVLGIHVASECMRPAKGQVDIRSRGMCVDKNGMIHAGQLIERTLHNQGRTVTWFATQLCCTRPNVYKIFRKENIDIHLLWRISCILEHDFFHDLSDGISNVTVVAVSK